MSSTDTEQSAQPQDDGGEVDVVLDDSEVLQSSEDSSRDSVDDRSVAVGDESKDSSDLEDYGDKVQKRIDKLTNRYREAERRENAALDYARGLQVENKDLSSRINNLDKGYRSEFSTRIDSQLTEAKARYKEAYDSGDVDALVEAQESLSTLAAQKERVSWAAQLQKAQQAQQAQKAQAAQPQTDSTQAAPAQTATPPVVAQTDPRAKDWFDDNSWFGEDEAMTYAALGFHRTLTEKEGYQGTEEAYYTEVDRRMKDAFPHKYNGAAQPGQNRPAQSVAPATRKQKSGRSTSVRLSSSERDIAKRLGISEKQYAAQKLKLEEQRV
jgi:hypothetical protein